MGGRGSKGKRERGLPPSHSPTPHKAPEGRLGGRSVLRSQAPNSQGGGTPAGEASLYCYATTCPWAPGMAWEGGLGAGERGEKRGEGRRGEEREGGEVCLTQVAVRTTAPQPGGNPPDLSCNACGRENSCDWEDIHTDRDPRGTYYGWLWAPHS